MRCHSNLFHIYLYVEFYIGQFDLRPSTSNSSVSLYLFVWLIFLVLCGFSRIIIFLYHVFLFSRFCLLILVYSMRTVNLCKCSNVHRCASALLYFLQFGLFAPSFCCLHLFYVFCHFVLLAPVSSITTVRRPSGDKCCRVGRINK